MQLKVLLPRTPRHSDCVCGVGWANSDEVLSCGDDQQLLRWNMMNLEATQVAMLPQGVYPTAMRFSPRNQQARHNDVVAVSATDGKLHLVSRLGKIDRSVDAHHGAALCVRWSPDGTGILTTGQDGAVKQWSRAGLLRSVLAQLSDPCYACAWSANSSAVLYTSAEYAYVKSLKTQMPPLRWKAHDGLILCADWSASSDLIVTGAEDCKFKVWDSYGRAIFASAPHDFPMTSIGFSPDGALFAVGSFGLLRLCDKAGWTHSLEMLSTGSVLGLSWSPDGTQLAAGCAGGHVVHAHLIEKRVSYRNLEVVQTKHNVVEVRDVSSDVAQELLETRDRVTRLSIAHEHLLLLTTKQLYIFSARNWNTPVIVDLQDAAVSMIVQAERLFLLSDGVTLTAYSYEGRQLAELKWPGGGGAAASAAAGGAAPLTERTVALAPDTVAAVDRVDASVIHLLDPATSKTQGDGKITHTADVVEVCLSQSGPLQSRLLAFIDISSLVFIAQIKTYGKVARTAKIGSLVQRVCFHDTFCMLAGLYESSLVVWPSPAIVFEDRRLLERTVMEKRVDGLGKFPELMNFTRNGILLRRSDGSLLPAAFSPFPAALLSHIEQSKWDQSIRLARRINEDTFWATLAGLSLQAKNVYAAEIAFGALDEIEHAEFLRDIRSEKDKEMKAAMMAMLAGKVSDADVQLERGGHAFQAVMLNITSFRWERALDIAIKHPDLLEVVIGYRQRFLQETDKAETNDKFLKYQSQVEVDWPHIRQVIASERAKEPT